MKALAIAVSAIALLSSAAFAQDTIVVQKKAVVYSDLNLGSQDGVAALRNRIVAAADEVCTVDAQKADNHNADYGYCRAKALRNAAAQVGEKISYRLSSAQ